MPARDSAFVIIKISFGIFYDLFGAITALNRKDVENIIQVNSSFVL